MPMFGYKVLLGATFILCFLHAEALPVHVQFEWPAGMPNSTVAHIRVEASRSAGYTISAAPVVAEAAQGGVDMDLGDGVWHVQASVPGYWSPGAEVAVRGQPPDAVRIALWPAASLQGEFATAGGEPLPQAVEVQLSSSPATAVQEPGAAIRQQQVSSFRATLRCPINRGSWSCLAPAGLFDVRLQAAEYTPHYL